jgi:hypothetical protein
MKIILLAIFAMGINELFIFNRFCAACQKRFNFISKDL